VVRRNGLGYDASKRGGKLRATGLPSVEAALVAARNGAPDGVDRLVEALYPELRRIARARLRQLRPGRTLDTTGLVHEAYLKLIRSREFADRVHFLAASARAMRHILVNAARRKLARKHGGGIVPDSLADREPVDERAQFVEILEVGEALDRLRRFDERLCRLVECRFYAGMTEQETAAALEISDRTVRRDWLRARAWLKQELGRLPTPARESDS
jgi:RNA polymerase sigma factor (TIGR02999 family)